MCSVIAVSGDWKIDIIDKILLNSRIRGLHSFGFSYVENNIIKNHKFIVYEKFKKCLFDIKPTKFIAHYRYSTSGDWKIINNNQPILVNNMCLAFNGVIDMGDKLYMEKKYNYKMQTDNDGEIAIYKYNEGKDYFLQFINENNRTFAGVFLNNKNKIIAIRNNLRPMAISYNINTYYLASTTDILYRSGVTNIEKLQSNIFYEF